MPPKETIKKMLPRFVREAINLHNRIRHQGLISKRNSEIIKELLRGAMPIKLDLGAGDRKMEGWTSVDRNGKCVLNLDLAAPMPFPDNSVSIIYSSHVLEHFNISELFALLNECKRILKVGGIFSAAVPNARIYIEAYQSPKDFKPEFFCRYKPAYNFNSKIDYINHMAYMDGHHKYMFDEGNLVVILKKAGFKQVRLRGFDKSLDLVARDYQSIYVQAVK